MSASIDLLYLSKYCCCCLTVFVREEMWLTISAWTYFPLGLSYSISLRNFSMCLSGKMLKCICEAIFPNFMLQQTAHLYTSRPLRQSFKILILTMFCLKSTVTELYQDKEIERDQFELVILMVTILIRRPYWAEKYNSINLLDFSLLYSLYNVQSDLKGKNELCALKT